MSSDADTPSRQDQAAAWFAAERAGMMLAEQRVAFDEWRKDPRNQAALDAMHQLWNDMAILKGAPVTPAAAPARKSARLARVAAGVALLAIAGIGAMTWSTMASANTIETATGEQKTRSMPDGSLVAVNVASNLRYSINDKERVVTLGDGEAAFTVKPDTARPFVVRAAEFEIRAVGTAFNVRQRHGAIEVAVSQGKVEICRNTGKGVLDVLARLGPGERITIPAIVANGILDLTPHSVPAEQVSEWRMRVVTYEDAPVREVVEDFNRYFDRKLIVEKRELLDRRVTVRLRVDDRDHAVETLASLLDAKVRQIGAAQAIE